MADFYTQMAGVANELLAPTPQGGLGQGTVKLVKYTATPPVNPWDLPGPPSRTETTLKAAVRGVSKEFIGMEIAPNNPIVATDLVVIVAPWGGTYEPGDSIEIDGRPATVLRYDNIPAAGITSAIRFIVRQ